MPDSAGRTTSTRSRRAPPGCAPSSTIASLVDEKALKKAGAFGILSAGNVIQVIVGGEADGLSMDINDML